MFFGLMKIWLQIYKTSAGLMYVADSGVWSRAVCLKWKFYEWSTGLREVMNGGFACWIRKLQNRKDKPAKKTTKWLGQEDKPRWADCAEIWYQRIPQWRTLPTYMDSQIDGCALKINPKIHTQKVKLLNKQVVENNIKILAFMSE